MRVDELLEIYETVPRSYYEWMVDRLAPDIASPVLEIGSGPGIVTSLLLERGHRVTALETEEDVLERLRALFADRDGFCAVRGDAEKDDLRALPGAPFSTIVCLNVLEHLADERGALDRCAAALAPKGKLVVLTPALPLLFGRLDAWVGHRRRYTRSRLERILRGAGFEARVRYFNLLGIAGWLWQGRVRGSDRFSARHNRLFGRILPVLRFVEARFPPPVGLSLIAVCRKRTECGTNPRT